MSFQNFSFRILNFEFKLMCLAFPYQIVKIKGNKAKIRINSQEQEIDISLVKAKKGDFVLVQNSTAIKKIPRNQIKELTALFI